MSDDDHDSDYHRGYRDGMLSGKHGFASMYTEVDEPVPHIIFEPDGSWVPPEKLEYVRGYFDGHYRTYVYTKNSYKIGPTIKR